MPPTPRACFSQANKLCFRATPSQSTWLAAHLPATGLSVTRLMRDALDRYIAAHAPSPHPHPTRQERHPTMTTAAPADDRPANVYSYLDLSTGHLPHPVFEGLKGIRGVIADEYGYGTWLYVPQDIDEWLHEHDYVSSQDAKQLRDTADDDPDSWPESQPELEAILRHARQLGCGWVRLDQDGASDPALPTREW
jgi:hypothetical protein